MRPPRDRKSTRLNSSHTEIYTLSLHDALPIAPPRYSPSAETASKLIPVPKSTTTQAPPKRSYAATARSEEHTSELQSHRDLHSFPTRRSSDRAAEVLAVGGDRVEVDPGAEVDYYAGAAEALVCGHRVHEPVGPNLVRVVDANRHAGLD